MGNILYVIAVVLIIIWAISFLGGYYTGGLIHILLVIAIIAIVYKLLTGRNAV
ncbi:lmo0937 family membrane protein [Ginsengibacter hankyongi]|uniref:Lmo0937 family membrane protein n=1 Tax=Ginsengibacter hankyongi TaxID=2607284 RepID=A0A5J5IGC3_9BACT|nr:lmo0937 family membrane protein [Ginsengibacter hankyongi]KAA9038401.1 lmo0937 family membrane protein [Ginsengibacter hankyongi]